VCITCDLYSFIYLFYHVGKIEELEENKEEEIQKELK